MVKSVQSLRRDAPLAAGLLRPASYPHAVKHVRLLETHISWILLTGEYAYKIKKPVDLGFANFSTLARRRRCCEEEVRLNRQLAPSLYLKVVPVRGKREAPYFGGKGKVLDYAVKMREFPQQALASNALAEGRFGAAEIDLLAGMLAGFHAATPAAPAGGPFGTPAAILASALQNFEQMLALVKKPHEKAELARLRRWTEREHASRSDVFEKRKSAGFVCECHGDLHLGNIVLLEGCPVPFDRIEFSDDLRCIDVLSEVAFLVMDLIDRRRGGLGWRFLNRYLEATGDYSGIAVLRFYMVYRALVRAKVHLMRAHQPGLSTLESRRLVDCYRIYLRLAKRLAASRRPALIIAHGLSGSGKTTATQSLIEEIGAIRLRSDVERKRMHGIAALASSGSALDAGIYSPQKSAATYRRLATLAQDIARAGYPVVVDATFLKRTEREAFRALAEKLDVPCMILNFRTSLAVLRERVARRRARQDDVSEADLAVLERQIVACEPLTPGEIGVSVVIDGTRPPARRAWRRLIESKVPAARRSSAHTGRRLR